MFSQGIRKHPEAAAKRAKAGRLWVEENFVRKDLASKMMAFVEKCAETRSR